MSRKRLYKGLSFVRYKDNKSLSLSDIELVKQDILNHIFTRRSERLMMPSFGTVIPDLPFEQLDDNTIFAFEEDLLEVIDYDPRVVFNGDGPLSDGYKIVPLYDENALIAYVDLYYVELDRSETIELRLEFE